MSVSKDIVLTDEERLDLVASISKVAMGLFTGQLETKKISVELEIPVGFVEVYEKIATKVGISTKELFSQLANDGLKLALEKQLQNVQPKEQKEEKSLNEQTDEISKQLKAIGFDPTAIMEKFSKFQELTGTLTNMQKVVENATSNLSTEHTDPNTKNNS